MRKRYSPLVWLFWSRKFSIEQGMDWLQQNGHISDLCQTPDDVCSMDVLRILDLAKAPMFAGVAYREAHSDWLEQRCLEGA